VLYWTVNNVVTILQTMVFVRLKKADAAKGKRPKKAREPRGAKP
jgi:membrane protein insertase Oxa1/YidC/SpoIIIJ